MKIKSGTYKGFKYSIEFTSEGDWRQHQNMFYAKDIHGILSKNFFKTYDETMESVKKGIDNYLEKSPKTKEEFLSEIEGCIVWDGYEEAHIDTDRVWFLFNQFKKVKLDESNNQEDKLSEMPKQ